MAWQGKGEIGLYLASNVDLYTFAWQHINILWDLCKGKLVNQLVVYIELNTSLVCLMGVIWLLQCIYEK